MNTVWQNLQSDLQGKLDSDEYATWFRPLRVAREDRDQLVLVAPNARFVHTLEETYRDLVDRSAAALRGASYKIVFTVDEKPPADTVGAATIGSPLNPRYLFANFVVGSSNQFAHAAARAV